MWTISPVVLVAILFTILVSTSTAASPTANAANSANSFSVPLVSYADKSRHGPSEVLRTLKKYRLPIPDGLQETVEKHQAKTALLAALNDDPTGSIPTNSKDGDLLWLAPVGIGSPPQKLFVDIDTGSTDSWFFSTETEKTEVNGQTLYDPSNSSTASSIKGCSWSILYGDWSTSAGSCYKDTFTLGNLSIPEMTIEVAASVSDMFTETSYMSGLVGLAWPGLTQTAPPQKTLIEFLSDVLTKPIFTVDFRHNSSDGSFNFGYIDDQLYDSEIMYAAIDNSDGFWGVQHTAFGIGGENLTYSFLNPKHVILDTGTTLLFAPDAAVDTYFAKIPGANYSEDEFGYLVPCHADLPDFLWELADNDGNIVKGAVPGPYLIYAHTTDELCFAGLQSVSTLSGVDGIFGDIFLKSGFFVFDIKGKRVGAAPKALNTSDIERTAGHWTRSHRRHLKTIYV
ncbi:aspartic peptidase domain-containing protein [Xylaria sp. CBS 124048]|nr:aspartic peptidase domain-containing protein [Xylaria sp. CBS 124048]